MRWRLADDTAGQGAFFADEELVERHVGTGEFRGLEFLHVNAKRIVNEVPASSPVPFRYTINAYRGCSHACTYCLVGETPILLADGRTKPIADVRVGDRVYGTVRRGAYRRYVLTEVLDHWSTVKRAFRVTLADGTVLVTSGDHRFLTERGWKHVTGASRGATCRPHLTTRNTLMGTGKFAQAPKHDEHYRRGYLCGIVRGDGHLGTYTYVRPTGRVGDVHRFRLALADEEALDRARRFLVAAGVPTTTFEFPAGIGCRPMSAIRASSGASVDAVREIVRWPDAPNEQWEKGFLAGIFDAEGSCSLGVLRISNGNMTLLQRCLDLLGRFGFDAVVEPTRPNGVATVRLRGGLEARLRFFMLVDPAITRKRTIDGTAVKSSARLEVTAIEDLGLDVPMFDITTGTGDFVADGVVSHNCFARPTHEYLGFDIGDDFDRKLVVKVNAVERLRAELRSPRWGGDHIAMGTNTDPYQRAEGKYHLTRGIVEVLGEMRNPFSILTKSTLIVRDLDVLTEAAAHTDVRANFSIGTLDEAVWKASEPGTPHPRRRVEAVRRLNEAGIPCGVLVAPVLPGLSDRPEQLEAVVGACVDAGAVSITPIVLHLRPGVRNHFMAWLRGVHPDLVDDYERRYRRSYLPQKEQEALAETVRGMVQAAGGVVAPPMPRRARQPSPAPATPTPAQLSLLSPS
jgi:DNA repair photolyase